MYVFHFRIGSFYYTDVFISSQSNIIQMFYDKPTDVIDKWTFRASVQYVRTGNDHLPFIDADLTNLISSSSPIWPRGGSITPE